MLPESSLRYPGEQATSNDIRLLADEYRQAACALERLGRRGQPLSRSPFRLLAIHAIELYLNAFLMHHGYAPTNIRGMQHDLAKRANVAIENGLTLRKLTAAHLRTLAENREYLVTRYEPELSGTISQINRLSATLDQVAREVTKALARTASPKRRQSEAQISASPQ
jgi:hypothetical protein